MVVLFPLTTLAHRQTPEATVTLVPILKRGVSNQGILKSLVFHVLNLKSWIKLIFDKITYTYCVTNEFKELLRFKTWETRLFNMPPLLTGTSIAVASEQSFVHLGTFRPDLTQVCKIPSGSFR